MGTGCYTPSEIRRLLCAQTSIKGNILDYKPLEQARAIARPSREAMLQRDMSVYHFWNENRDLFTDAWAEWDESLSGQEYMLDDMIYDSALRGAVSKAWTDPTTEAGVKNLWREVFPGVYEAQFFDPERLTHLRQYLAKADASGIPVRPPFGISLNRGGAMLDCRSEGYLAAPRFQKFYTGLMEQYMRPIARLLFPDIIGYDTQTFGFSIQWQPETDTSLRAHTDASAVTLNINLNLPDENFEGSAVRFFDRETRQICELSFAPGTALIHHGSVPHETIPITNGERSNFVLWLYGDKGQIPPYGREQNMVSAQERWVPHSGNKDNFAPF